MDRNNFIEGMDLNGDHDLSLCDGFVHVKSIIPHSFEWVFSCKILFWACAHKPMWSYDNILWRGKTFFSLMIFLRRHSFIPWRLTFVCLTNLRFSKKIMVIKYDEGGEYNFKTFNVFYKENAIVKQTITPYTPK
jgi:hypothetical protein